MKFQRKYKITPTTVGRVPDLLLLARLIFDLLRFDTLCYKAVVRVVQTSGQEEGLMPGTEYFQWVKIAPWLPIPFPSRVKIAECSLSPTRCLMKLVTPSGLLKYVATYRLNLVDGQIVFIFEADLALSFDPKGWLDGLLGWYTRKVLIPGLDQAYACAARTVGNYSLEVI